MSNLIFKSHNISIIFHTFYPIKLYQKYKNFTYVYCQNKFLPGLFLLKFNLNSFLLHKRDTFWNFYTFSIVRFKGNVSSCRGYYSLLSYYMTPVRILTKLHIVRDVFYQKRKTVETGIKKKCITIRFYKCVKIL